MLIKMPRLMDSLVQRMAPRRCPDWWSGGKVVLRLVGHHLNTFPSHPPCLACLVPAPCLPCLVPAHCLLFQVHCTTMHIDVHLGSSALKGTSMYIGEAVHSRLH